MNVFPHTRSSYKLVFTCSVLSQTQQSFSFSSTNEIMKWSHQTVGRSVCCWMFVFQCPSTDSKSSQGNLLQMILMTRGYKFHTRVRPGTGVKYVFKCIINSFNDRAKVYLAHSMSVECCCVIFFVSCDRVVLLEVYSHNSVIALVHKNEFIYEKVRVSRKELPNTLTWARNI